MGHEEIDTIIPHSMSCGHRAFPKVRCRQTPCSSRNTERANAVLAMYHDQGLPVLKYQGFGRAVNITLGLPFIRTSVDHGTARNWQVPAKQMWVALSPH